MGGVIFGLKFFNPTIYHYMIEVPGAYPVDYPLAAKHIWEFLAESPLFLVLSANGSSSTGLRSGKDDRVRWLLAVLAVAIPFGAIAFAKYLGAANSMLPPLLAIMAFCALRLSRLVARLENLGLPLHGRLMSGSLLALLLLITVFPHPGVLATAFRDPVYWKAVDLAARLPGTVVCPEDPTIPLFASLPGRRRSIFTELDAHPVDGAWPRALPETVLADFRGADYVLDVIDYWDNCVHDQLLRNLGFTPAENLPIDPKCYRVWQRAEAGTPRTGPLPHSIDRRPSHGRKSSRDQDRPIRRDGHGWSGLP